MLQFRAKVAFPRGFSRLGRKASGTSERKLGSSDIQRHVNRLRREESPSPEEIRATNLATHLPRSEAGAIVHYNVPRYGSSEKAAKDRCTQLFRSCSA